VTLLMAETARSHPLDVEPPDPPRPRLQVVRGGDAGAAPDERFPNVGRVAMVGYAVGFVIATVVITIVGTVAGLGLGASFGLGVFVGAWGGGGFGFMMGGTIPLALHLEAQHARTDHRGQGDRHGTAAG
jgi:hypothetical protein